MRLNTVEIPESSEDEQALLDTLRKAKIKPEFNHQHTHIYTGKMFMYYLSGGVWIRHGGDLINNP